MISLASDRDAMRSNIGLTIRCRFRWWRWLDREKASALNGYVHLRRRGPVLDTIGKIIHSVGVKISAQRLGKGGVVV